MYLIQKNRCQTYPVQLNQSSNLHLYRLEILISYSPLLSLYSIEPHPKIELAYYYFFYNIAFLYTSTSRRVIGNNCIDNSRDSRSKRLQGISCKQLMPNIIGDSQCFYLATLM